MENKVCRKCGIERLLTEFSKDRSLSDGHRNFCKFCDRARENSPEVRARKNAYQREKARDWYLKYRNTEKGRAREKRRNESEKHQIYKESEHFRAYYRIYVQKRNALKKQLPSTFTEQDWQFCLEFFKFSCAYCGKKKKLHQDHFIPLSKNGGCTPDNIVPSCQTCNSRKSNKMPKDWVLPEVYSHIQTFFESLIANV